MRSIAWLHHVDQTFSPYIPDSPISRLGRAEITLDDLDDEITDVLLHCEQPPGRHRRRLRRLRRAGAQRHHARPVRVTSRAGPSNVRPHILEAHGHTDFTINAGGDIAVRGHAAPARRGRSASVIPTTVTSWRWCSTSSDPPRSPRQPPTNAAPTSSIPEPGSQPPSSPASPSSDPTSTPSTPTPPRSSSWASPASNGSPGHPGYDAMAITHDDRVHLTPGFSAWRRPRVGRRDH